MSSLAVNLALVNQGSNNINNPDEEGEILYAMGQTVANPDDKAIEYKQHYFHCKTTFNVVKANTNFTRIPHDDMEYSSLEYIFTCYLSGDVSGINRNEMQAGDYIKLNNNSNLWYKVNKVLEVMGGGQYCVVRAIQTSQNPELPNTNESEAGGVDSHNLLWK